MKIFQELLKYAEEKAYKPYDLDLIYSEKSRPVKHTKTHPMNPLTTKMQQAFEQWFSKTFEDGEALQWPTEYHTSLTAAIDKVLEGEKKITNHGINAKRLIRRAQFKEKYADKISELNIIRMGGNRDVHLTAKGKEFIILARAELGYSHKTSSFDIIYGFLIK